MFGTQSLVLTALPASAPYQTYTIPFTPSASGTYDLSFANAGGDNIGALLDNVVITSGTVSAVPEPSMLALMVAGCAGLRLRARRRAA